MSEIPAPYFAHRVVRAMTKVCASHEIGLDGVGFVAIVAMQWDTIRYARPVSYHIAPLLGILGVTSKDAFYRMERRCVASGWLVKRNQGTRKPVLYWVAIPERFSEVKDTPTEDGDMVSPTNNQTNGHTNTGLIPRLITDSYPDSFRTHNQTPSSYSSSLDPIPRPEDSALTDAADPSPKPYVLTDRERVRPLSPYVQWQTKDPERTADNLATLIALLDDHGPQVVLTAARDGSLRGSEKLWPNEILDHLPGAAPKPSQDMPLRSPEHDRILPQAQAIAQRLGWAEVVKRTGLGGVGSDRQLAIVLGANVGVCEELIAGEAP